MSVLHDNHIAHANKALFHISQDHIAPYQYLLMSIVTHAYILSHPHTVPCSLPLLSGCLMSIIPSMFSPLLFCPLPTLPSATALRPLPHDICPVIMDPSPNLEGHIKFNLWLMSRDQSVKESTTAFPNCLNEIFMLFCIFYMKFTCIFRIDAHNFLNLIWIAFSLFMNKICLSSRYSLNES